MSGFSFVFSTNPSSSLFSTPSSPGFSGQPLSPIVGSTSFGSVIPGPFSSAPTSTTSLFGSSSSSSGLFSTTPPTSTNWFGSSSYSSSTSYSSSNSGFSGSYTTTTTTSLFSTNLSGSSYSGSVSAKTDSIPSLSSPFSFPSTTASAPKSSTTASAKLPNSGVFGSVGPPPGSSILVKVEEVVDEVEEVNAEVELERDGLAKQPIVSIAEQEAVVPALRTDEDEGKKVLDTDVCSMQESVLSTVISATSFVPVEVEPNPSLAPVSANTIPKVPPAEAIAVTTNAPKAEPNAAGCARETSPGKEVQISRESAPIFVEKQAEGVSSAVSEAGRQTFCVSAPFVDVNGYCISAQNGPIAKQIFDKYGDITEGSIINNVAVKLVLLELIANAVYKLCNHTMKTLGLDELRLMEQDTADAVAVGFHVDWLQQRIKNVIAASDYHVHLMELDKLAKQIDDAKKSLMEMESKQAICMKELAAIKDKMEENGFDESKLGDGLL